MKRNKSFWADLSDNDRHITFEPNPKPDRDESFEAVVILDCLSKLTEEEREIISSFSTSPQRQPNLLKIPQRKII